MHTTAQIHSPQMHSARQPQPDAFPGMRWLVGRLELTQDSGTLKLLDLELGQLRITRDGDMRDSKP